MANAKEIKNHIKSVKDTQKITNAMYLISSTKMRKAKKDLNMTRPYFDHLESEIKRIFRTAENVESSYFFPATKKLDYDGTYGYLVITADKGLAGAYNQNVIKEATRLMKEHGDYKLFVVGEYGRRYFSSHGFNIDKSFLFTAQNPTIDRARRISAELLDMYDSGELVKMFIIYTDYRNGLSGGNAKSVRLLPFHRKDFYEERGEQVDTIFEFMPSLGNVLDNIMPSYISGFVYSALIDSFCSEQNARMMAMDSANKNAQELLDNLNLQYNHVRQGAITQEITEISSGARAQNKKQIKGGAKK